MANDVDFLLSLRIFFDDKRSSGNNGESVGAADDPRPERPAGEQLDVAGRRSLPVGRIRVHVAQKESRRADKLLNINIDVYTHVNKLITLLIIFFSIVY